MNTNRKSAFTLIELLVVIAIIGILAAITFPVYARVKDGAYRSSDTSNLNSIRTALQLYRTDQGAYPPQLLGYVTYYSGGGTVMPVNQYIGALYPKRVESLDTFKPSYLRGVSAGYANTVTNIVWPTGSYAGVSVASCEGAANVACKGQAYQPSDGYVSIDPSSGALGVTGTPVSYYSISGYDTAPVTTTAGTQQELRYTLFWSAYGLGQGSPNDTTNQLGYTDPSETTVITWDSFFRDYNPNGSVASGEKRDIVLFLGGSARPHDSTDVFAKAWQTTP